jgi:protein ImuB
VNPAAEKGGVFPGQALADARALAPDLRVVDHDPVGDARALDHLAGWCGRYTPWVAPDGLEGLWLDITGCAHLFGGEEAMIVDLVGRIARLGLAARAAVADTPGAAWAVARFGAVPRLGPGARAAVVPAGAVNEVLAGLPVAGLRLGPAIADGLARLGLKRIGDLYDLPRGPLAARFGDQVARRLDQALGVSCEPISPRHPVPPHRVGLSLPEPVIAAGDIACGCRRLLHGLCERLQREQRGMRCLEVTLYRVDGTVARARLGTARPVRDTEHLMRLLAHHLGRFDPGFGVEAMALAAPLTEELAPEEIELALAGPDLRSRESPAPDPRGGEELAVLIDRLGNRPGTAEVVRLAPHESHVPERAMRIVPVLGRAGGGHWRAGPPRPLRLFPRPHPVEVVAPVPDDPPLQFRWRRTDHRVRTAEGPERIAAEWWREDGPVRDYYRVEDTGGQRFWLYREGLYAPDRSPRWFLHGLFA